MKGPSPEQHLFLKMPPGNMHTPALGTVSAPWRWV